jgi:hypothetical protein
MYDSGKCIKSLVNTIAVQILNTLLYGSGKL